MTRDTLYNLFVSAGSSMNRQAPRSTIPSTFILAVLLLVTTFAPMVAEGVACTGYCASTLFDDTTAVLCDQVAITVDCTSSGVIYGGDVFSRASSNIQYAATWSGFCTSGQTGVNLYMYWAGQRSAFFGTRRVVGGPTSSSSPTPDFAILLSDQATCPTWLTTSIGYVANGVEATVGSTLVGSTYYGYGSRVDYAAAHINMVANSGDNTGPLFIHYLPQRSAYMGSMGRGWAFAAKGSYGTDLVGFYLSSSSTPDPNVLPNVQPIWIDASYNTPRLTGSNDNCYGFTAYHYSSVANPAVINSGLVKVGDAPGYVYAHHLENREHFFSAHYPTYSCSTVGPYSPAQPAIYFSKSPERNSLPELPPLPTTQFVQRLRFYYSGTVYGHTRYHQHSVLNQVAFFEDFVVEADPEGWTPEVVYVHQIGSLPFFPRRQKGPYQTSPYSGAYDAIMMTASPKPPNGDEQNKLELEFDGKNGYSSSYEKGIRVHNYASAPDYIAYVDGLYNINEKKTFYIHYLTSWDRFYNANRDTMATRDDFNPQVAYTLSETNTPPTDLTDSNNFKVKITATTWTQTCYGTYLYDAETSDIVACALHAGLIKLGEQKEIWIHYQTGPFKNFFGSTQNGFTSNSYLNVNHAGIILSLTGTVPNPAPAETNGGNTLTISDWRQPVQHAIAGAAQGSGHWLGSSDIARTVMLQGLFEEHETGTLYIHVCGTAGFLYGNRRFHEYSTDTMSSEDAYMISKSATFPTADCALLTSNGINIAYVKDAWPEYGNGCYGHIGGGFDKDMYVANCALHAGLVMPGESVTIYVHTLQTAAMGYYIGLGSNNLGGSAPRSSSDMYPYHLDTTTTPPPAFNPNIRKLHLCFKDHVQYGAASVYGTYFYTYSSNPVWTAFHAGLLKVGECKDIYFHMIGSQPYFYGSTWMDFRSYSTTTTEAMIPSLSATPPAPITFPLAINLRVSTIVELGTGSGCGIWGYNSDLSRAALMEGLIELGHPTPVTVYLHLGASRNWIPPCRSRGLETGYISSSITSTFALTATSTPPSWIASTTEAAASLEVVSTFEMEDDLRGTKYYNTQYGDVALAAMHEGILKLGERKTIYMYKHGVPTFGYFIGSYRYGIRSTYDTVSTRPAFEVSLTGGLTPTMPANYVPITYDYKDMSSSSDTIYGVGGLYWYGSFATAAAVHAGLVPTIGSGTLTTVYAHKLTGTRTVYYGCTANGIVSSSYSSGGGGWILTGSTATPATPPTGKQQLTLKGEAFISPTWPRGYGYYQFSANILDAAMQEGIIKEGDMTPVTVWVHDLGSRNRWVSARSVSFTKTSNSKGFYLDTTGTGHTPVTDVIPISVRALDLTSFSCYGTYVYHIESNPIRAAQHMGLINGLDKAPVQLYIHFVGSRNIFLASYQNGVQSTYTSTAQGFVLSTSPTTIPVAMPASTDMHPFVITPATSFEGDVGYRSYVYGGPGYWDKSTDVVVHAYAAGYYDLPLATSKTLYVYSPTSASRRRFYTTHRAGLMTRSGSASYMQAMWFSTVDTVPPTCVTSDTTWYARIRGEITPAPSPYNSLQGTNPYYYGSFMSAAAVHSGHINPGETKVLKFTYTNGALYNSASSANGFTSTATTTNGFGLQIDPDDGGCSAFAFPADTPADANIGALSCSHTDCLNHATGTLWSTPSGISQGTKSTVKLHGNLYQKSYVYGSGQYSYRGDIAAMALHSGALQPDEVADIDFYFIGPQNIHVGSSRNGVKTNGVYGSIWNYAVVVKRAPSTPPTYYSQDIVPVPARLDSTYHSSQGGYGFGIYDVETGTIEKMAFLQNMIGFRDATDTVVFVHYAGPKTMYPATYRYGFHSGGYYHASNTRHGIVLTTSSAVPSATSFPMQVPVDCTNPTLGSTQYGAGYYSLTQSFVSRSAVLEDLCTTSQNAANVWIHMVGNVEYFPGKSKLRGLFTYGWYFANAAYYVSSTNTPPTITPNVYPVKVDLLDSPIAPRYTGSGIYGTEGGYRYDGDVRAAALYQGLLATTIGSTATVNVHFASGLAQGTMRRTSNYKNYVRTQHSSSSSSMDYTFTVTASGVTTAPAYSTTVVKVVVDRDFHYIPDREDWIEGTGYMHSYHEDAAAMAIHNNLYTVGSGPATFYLHDMDSQNYKISGNVNNGIGTAYANNKAVCISTSSSTHNCGWVSDSLQVEVTNYRQTFATTSYMNLAGHIMYYYTTNLHRAFWASYLVNEGETKTLYWHIVGTGADHPVVPAGYSRGYVASYSAQSGSIPVFVPATTAAATAENPYTGTPGSYKYRFRMSPDESVKQFTISGTIKGTTEYTTDSVGHKALFLSGLLDGNWDGLEKTYYWHNLGVFKARHYKATRGYLVSSQSTTNSHTYIVSNSPTTAGYVAERHTLKCSHDYGTIQGIHYHYYTTDLCKAARQAGLLASTATDVTFFAHTVANNAMSYLTGWKNGVYSTQYTSVNRLTFIVSLTATVPSYNFPLQMTLTPYPIYQTTTFYGTHPYNLEGELNQMLVHAGYPTNVPVTVWLHYDPRASGRGVLLGCHSFGVRSNSYTSTNGMDFVWFSNSATPSHSAYNENIIEMKIEASWIEYTFSTYGIYPTYYHTSAYWTQAAVAQGLITPYATPGVVQATVYAHKVTGVKRYYAFRRWGMNSASVRPYIRTAGSDAYYLSNSATPIVHNEAVREMTVTLDYHPYNFGAVYGAGQLYWTDTYLDAALLHSNLVLPVPGASPVTIYVHDQSINNRNLPMVFSNGISGAASAASASSWRMSITLDSAAPTIPPDRLTFYVSPVLGTVYGPGMFRWSDDMSKAALNEGWLVGGRGGYLTWHEFPSMNSPRAYSRFYSQQTSSASKSVFAGGMLSCQDEPLETCRRPNANAFTAWVRVDEMYPIDYQSYLRVIPGAPNKYRFNSFLMMAALYQGDLNVGEQGEFLVDWSGGAPGASFTAQNWNTGVHVGGGMTTSTGTDDNAFTLTRVHCMKNRPPCQRTPTAVGTVSPSGPTSEATISAERTVTPAFTITGALPTPAPPTPVPPTPIPPTPVPPTPVPPSPVPATPVPPTPAPVGATPVPPTPSPPGAPTAPVTPLPPGATFAPPTPVPPGVPSTPTPPGATPSPPTPVPTTFAPPTPVPTPAPVPLSNPTEFTVQTPPQLNNTEEEVPPGEVKKVVIKADVTPAGSNNNLVIKCSSANGSPLLSDGETGITSEVTFQQDVGQNSQLEIPLFVVGPDTPGTEEDITCDVAGQTVNVTLSAPPTPVSQTTGRDCSAVIPDISDAEPPLNSEIPAGQNTEIQLEGQDLDCVPKRVLVGPYVAEVIPDPANPTRAKIVLPPPKTCAELMANHGISGTTKDDEVFGWKAGQDPAVQNELAQLCNGVDPQTVVQPKEFTPVISPGKPVVKKAPVVRVELYSSLNSQYLGQQRRRQSTGSILIGPPVVLEAGAPSSTIYARFEALDGDTLQPDPSILVKSSLGVVNPTEVALDQYHNILLPSTHISANVTEVFIHAPSSAPEAMPLYITRVVGPRTYNFVEMVTVLKSTVTGSITQDSDTQCTMSITTLPGTIDARNASVNIFARALGRSVSLSTADSRCTDSGQGLLCVEALLSVGSSASFVIEMKVPAGYRRSFELVYEVSADNANMTTSGTSTVLGEVTTGAVTATTTQAANRVSEPTTTLANVPQAALRSIFGSSNTLITCTDPLFFLLITFWVALVAMIIFKLVSKKKGILANSWIDIPQWRSLMVHHAYLQLFVPCHAGCAITHAVLPFLHVLYLMLIVSVLTQFVTAGTDFNLWVSAVLGPVLVVPLKPLFGYYYWMWTRDEEEYEEGMRIHREATARRLRSTTKLRDDSFTDGGLLTEKGKKKLSNINLLEGVSKNAIDQTLTNLDDIQLTESPAAHGALDHADVEVEDDVVVATEDQEQGGGTVARLNEQIAEVDFESESDDLQTVGSTSDIDDGTRSVAEDEENIYVPDAPVDVSAIVDPFIIKGHVICSVFALIGVGLTFLLMSQKTDTETCSLFLDAFLMSLLIDFGLIQPISLLFLYIYRWMVKEDDEEHLFSELHPCHGERRIA